MQESFGSGELLTRSVYHKKMESGDAPRASQSSVPGEKMEPISLSPSGPLAHDRLMNEDGA